jgi:ethanolamine utilization protein EutL
MKHDPLKTTILSTKLIANADPSLLKSIKVPKGYNSLGIITTDCDDVSYVALDEATKKAAVEVVYAKSMYAGAANASTRLAGEFVGILAGPDPSEVLSGLSAAQSFIESGVCCFYSADDEDRIAYFAHCISRSGNYLSKSAKVKEGTPIAYLIAPPIEAIYSLDVALKAADVEMKLFYGPPTETNFAGGLLIGDQAACKAACDAFAESVCYVGDNPFAL